MSRSRPMILLLAVTTPWIAPPATRADGAAAEAVLRDAGLKLISSSYILQEEIDANDLADEIRKLPSGLQALEERLRNLKAEYNSKSSEAGRLMSEATKVTYEYNSQTKRYEERRTTDDSKLAEAWRKSSEAESIRIRNFPAERELEAQIDAGQRKIQGEQARHGLMVSLALGRYEALAARPEINAALRELNRGTRPKLALGPIADYGQNVFRQSVDTMAALGYRRENDLYWLPEDGEFIKRCDQANLIWREVAIQERRMASPGRAASDGTVAPAPVPAGNRTAAIPPARLAAGAGRAAPAPAILMTSAQVAARRAEVVRRVRELRLQADALQKRRDALLADVETSDSLEEINRASSKRRQAKIGTRPGLKKAIQDLEAMGRAIRAETISLTRDGSALKAEVRLNDKSAWLIVDPAAEWVHLPDRLAAELGVRPAPDARTVPVALGDGGVIQARRATIRSLRLGSFSAEGVECLVLPPVPGDGPAVLGGPALTRVVAELDGGSATLTLSWVDPPPAAPPR